MQISEIVEREATALSGWLMLPVWLALAGWAAWAFFSPLSRPGGEPAVVAILAVPVLILLGKGFLTLQPNQASVMVFFGRYAGTLGQDGFFGSIRFINANGSRCARGISTRPRSRSTIARATPSRWRP